MVLPKNPKNLVDLYAFSCMPHLNKMESLLTVQKVFIICFCFVHPLFLIVDFLVNEMLYFQVLYVSMPVLLFKNVNLVALIFNECLIDFTPRFGTRKRL